MTCDDKEFQLAWTVSLLGWAVDWIEQHDCKPDEATEGKDLLLLHQARDLAVLGKADSDMADAMAFLLASPDARRSMKSSVMREMLVSVGVDFAKLDAADLGK